MSIEVSLKSVNRRRKKGIGTRLGPNHLDSQGDDRKVETYPSLLEFFKKEPEVFAVLWPQRNWWEFKKRVPTMGLFIRPEEIIEKWTDEELASAFESTSVGSKSRQTLSRYIDKSGRGPIRKIRAYRKINKYDYENLRFSERSLEIYVKEIERLWTEVKKSQYSDKRISGRISQQEVGASSLIAFVRCEHIQLYYAIYKAGIWNSVFEYFRYKRPAEKRGRKKHVYKAKVEEYIDRIENLDFFEGHPYDGFANLVNRKEIQIYRSNFNKFIPGSGALMRVIAGMLTDKLTFSEVANFSNKELTIMVTVSLMSKNWSKNHCPNLLGILGRFGRFARIMRALEGDSKI